MIPVKLKMRNFMCYRDNVPALDFTGIHLACLSGDNGNGKSAIIDAITWALWGKARAGSDDDLIFTTQTEMEVEFEFTVEGQLYRIIRKRSRPKKKSGAGQPSLDLFISGENGFRAITGNNMTQTQLKIIEILHMDYDTFINSAYLRQGHADEFTRQAPAKRKEVLGNILGLGVYDELEEKAKEFVKQHESDSSQLENTIREISGELAQQPVYEAELEKAQQALSGIDVLFKLKESGLNELRKKKEILDARKTQLSELEERIGSGARNLKRWEEQTRQHLDKAKQYGEIIARHADIEAGFTELSGVKKAVDELDRKFRQLVALDKQKEAIDRKIDHARNELLRNYDVIKNSISEIEKKVQKLPDLKNQLGQSQAQVLKLADSEAVLLRKEQSVEEGQKQASLLEAEKTRLEKEINEINDKLGLVSRHLALHTEAKCPLCERELTKEGLELISTKYTGELRQKTEALKLTGENLARERKVLDILRKEKSGLETTMGQEKTRCRTQEETIKNKIKEIEEDTDRLAEQKAALETIEQQLAKRDFALNEQAALAEIENEIAKLTYDAEKHEQLRQDLSRLGHYENEKNKLVEAEKLIGQEKEAATQAESEAGSLRGSLKLDGEKKEALAGELVALPGLHKELAAAESEYQALGMQRSQAQEAVGSVRARLQRLAELMLKKKEKEGLLASAGKEETIYKELAKAFGKGGIQALIIETVLPEIENEANSLLSRMTDNRMHVKFETQKETKKGTVQETLDISIADELGTRNYEMFSGGEAFRINFAVRIALSRLLARRARATLPTLIIDEGFGTQDSTGMEKLKEAINSIQGDFEKILVITHMDELKDAFPARIDVTKTAEGSMITVNQ
jgi:exonuclease SbcC